ncbi:MAG: hypothetical protein WD492_05530, partial [Alkalispirochaeta sp.]
MRVVYDYGMGTTTNRPTTPTETGAPRNLPAAEGAGSVRRRESVIVISLTAEESSSHPNAPDSADSPDYEVAL